MEPPKPTAPEHVDDFSSKHLDRETLIARWGDELVQLVRDVENETFEQKKTALEAKIKASGNFVLVDIAAITYFSPRTSYLTVDLVDADDTARIRRARRRHMAELATHVGQNWSAGSGRGYDGAWRFPSGAG